MFRRSSDFEGLNFSCIPVFCFPLRLLPFLFSLFLYASLSLSSSFLSIYLFLYFLFVFLSDIIKYILIHITFLKYLYLFDISFCTNRCTLWADGISICPVRSGYISLCFNKMNYLRNGVYSWRWSRLSGDRWVKETEVQLSPVIGPINKPILVRCISFSMV